MLYKGWLFLFSYIFLDFCPLLCFQETHVKTMTSLARVDESLSASLVNITVLEKSSSDAGEKYIFMQRLRDFVSVICDFLQV